MMSGITQDLLAGSAIVASQPPLVHDVRNKSADVGVHPPRCREKNSTVRRNGVVAGEKILKRRKSALSRMSTLNWLGKLHRVTNQHDVRRAGRHRHDIGNR